MHWGLSSSWRSALRCPPLYGVPVTAAGRHSEHGNERAKSCALPKLPVHGVASYMPSSSQCQARRERVRGAQRKEGW